MNSVYNDIWQLDHESPEKALQKWLNKRLQRTTLFHVTGEEARYYWCADNADTPLFKCQSSYLLYHIEKSLEGSVWMTEALLSCFHWLWYGIFNWGPRENCSIYDKLCAGADIDEHMEIFLKDKDTVIRSSNAIFNTCARYQYIRYSMFSKKAHQTRDSTASTAFTSRLPPNSRKDVAAELAPGANSYEPVQKLGPMAWAWGVSSIHRLQL